jgi:hypothetical protein
MRLNISNRMRKTVNFLVYEIPVPVQDKNKITERVADPNLEASVAESDPDPSIIKQK